MKSETLEILRQDGMDVELAMNSKDTEGKKCTPGDRRLEKRARAVMKGQHNERHPRKRLKEHSTSAVSNVDSSRAERCNNEDENPKRRSNSSSGGDMAECALDDDEVVQSLRNENGVRVEALRMPQESTPLAPSSSGNGSSSEGNSALLKSSTLAMKGSKHDDDKDDARILQGLFSSCGIDTALSHDAIMKASRHERVLIEKEVRNRRRMGRNHRTGYFQDRNGREM